LIDLLLGSGILHREATLFYIPVFGLGCFVAAFLVLLLDLCVFVVRRRSFLALQHGPARTFLAAVMLPSAAAIVGTIGLMLDVLQPSRAACVVVGVAWPSLMTILMGVPAPEGVDDEADEEGEELT
jgi:hypothetical protein